MVLTCNLGCVGEGATAVRLMPDKRFLTSLPPLCSRLPVAGRYSVTHPGKRGALHIVSLLWIGERVRRDDDGMMGGSGRDSGP